MKYETFLRLIQQYDRGSGLSRNEIFTHASENHYFELFIIVAMIEDGVKQGDLVVHPHASEPRYSISSSAKLRLHKEKNAENFKKYFKSAQAVANAQSIPIKNKRNWGKIITAIIIVGSALLTGLWYAIDFYTRIMK